MQSAAASGSTLVAADDNRFGCQLKLFRERHRLSQSKLAKRADFDHSYISRLESGDRTPTKDAVLRLSQAMQLERTDRDRLLVAGDFLPFDINCLLEECPEIQEAVRLLADETISPAAKLALRDLYDRANNLVRAYIA